MCEGVCMDVSCVRVCVRYVCEGVCEVYVCVCEDVCVRRHV